MKKILVIDDDSELVEIVEQILVSSDFDVHVHTSGLNVPDVVKNYNPNLILLDIRLYGASGMDICRKLKKTYHMPIILFSADCIRGEEFENCDADGFLAKPFNISDLLGTMAQHLNTSNAIA